MRVSRMSPVGELCETHQDLYLFASPYRQQTGRADGPGGRTLSMRWIPLSSGRPRKVIPEIEVSAKLSLC